MKTFSRIVNGFALDCVTVENKEDIFTLFPEGQIETWGGLDAFTEVPLGTPSSSRCNGNGTYTPPEPPAPAVEVVPTKQEILDKIAALLAIVQNME